MYDINELLKEACEMCDSVGVKYGEIVKIEVSGRLTSSWGICKRTNGKYYIKIARRLMETNNKAAIMDTLLHEVIHTVSGCMDHREAWKANAEKLNQRYGLRIKRSTSPFEKGIVTVTKPPRDSKYAVKCPHCGHVWYYKFEKEVVKYPETYRCSFCDVPLIRVPLIKECS